MGTTKTDSVSRDWLTMAEVCKALRLSHRSVSKLCKDGTLKGTKIPWRGQWRWAIQPDEVNALAESRNEKQAKRDAGLEWCPSCKSWKEREEFGYYGEDQTRDAYCRQCRSDSTMRSKARRKAKKRRWYDGWGSERVGGTLDELVADHPPAQPSDSLKYACMGEGYSHRPIPFGETKRQAFCSKCEADFCVHYPDMTPDEVQHTIRPKVTYAKAQRRI